MPRFALDALLVVVLATLTFAPLVVAHHVLSAPVAHTTHNRRLGRLRIIGARSGHGVGLLRVSGLVTCVHVSTVSNLSDLLTKALDTSTFRRLRDQLMYWCPL